MAQDKWLELYEMKAELCKTFADAKRLRIIDALRGGEKTVSELVKLIGSSQAVVSRHLMLLRDRGVVKARREGVNMYYSLTDNKIGEACDLVHQVLLNQIQKDRERAEKLGRLGLLQNSTRRGKWRTRAERP